MNVDEYHARMQALRAELDDPVYPAPHEGQHPDACYACEQLDPDQPTVDDFCRKCGEPTDRTDRLCELHHNAALAISDQLRILR